MVPLYIRHWLRQLSASPSWEVWLVVLKDAGIRFSDSQFNGFDFLSVQLVLLVIV